MLLGLKPRQRMPKGVLVRQWFGISEDESSRATFPGVYQTKQITTGTDLYKTPIVREVRQWMPANWRNNAYPLLNEVWLPERKIETEAILPRREQRHDCVAWLKTHYPERTFPRSACIGCPFRSNAEWLDMRDNRPEEWEDACEFDDAQRELGRARAVEKHILVGTPYVHRQMVPLRMADLGGDGEKGGGCGTLYDGQDGMCDV